MTVWVLTRYDENNGHDVIAVRRSEDAAKAAAPGSGTWRALENYSYYRAGTGTYEVKAFEMGDDA